MHLNVASLCRVKYMNIFIAALEENVVRILTTLSFGHIFKIIKYMRIRENFSLRIKYLYLYTFIFIYSYVYIHLCTCTSTCVAISLYFLASKHSQDKLRTFKWPSETEVHFITQLCVYFFDWIIRFVYSTYLEGKKIKKRKLE